jgi:hypothetical protein
MKKICLIIFCSFTCFHFLSCDPASEGEISINNKSSYNLRLNFQYKWNYNDSYLNSIDVNKNTTVSFTIDDIGTYSQTNPNLNMDKIIFLNLDDLSIKKELEVNKQFVVINSDKIGISYYKSSYSLEITDELLSE